MADLPTWVCENAGKEFFALQDFGCFCRISSSPHLCTPL